MARAGYYKHDGIGTNACGTPTQVLVECTPRKSGARVSNWRNHVLVIYFL